MTDQANTAPVNPMPPEVLEALQGSIAKWEGIVDGTREDKGHRDCPLCQMFLHARACRGCPVMARTGKAECRGTPYRDSFDVSAIAQAELDFLKSLLPGAAS